MPPSPVQAANDAVPTAPGLYEADLHAWSVLQAELLQRQEFEALDWENVAEEIESLGSEQRNAWASLCGNVIEHLLKIEHCAGDKHLARWQAQIEEWREQMAERLADNPSLTGRYAEIFVRAWERGRSRAVRRITYWARLPRASKAERDRERSVGALLPETCPYRLLGVTAYDTEERKPSVRRDIMPPAVATVLNERAGAKYSVRPWPGLDRKLEAGAKRFRGRSR